MLNEKYKLQLIRCIDLTIHSLNNIKKDVELNNLNAAIEDISLCIKRYPDIKRQLLFFNNIQNPIATGYQPLQNVTNIKKD